MSPIPEAATATVTVYVIPSCVQCNATHRALDRLGVPYREVDLTQDPDARDCLRALGHQQAPVVVIGDQHWSGYRPDLIGALADRRDGE